MPEYLQVFQAKVPESAVAPLLEVREAAIAEAQRLCPELVGAMLVRGEDGVWLDVLRWTVPDGEERLMQHASEFDHVLRMHELLTDASQVTRGEIVAAAGR